MKFFLNDTLIGELIEDASQSLFPLDVTLDQFGFITQVRNFKEISQIWNDTKTKLFQLYENELSQKLINRFAFNLQNINPSYSIEILEKIISEFPKRTVAYLNLADSYWSIGEKEKAVDNYEKYIFLMKSQKKT